jgi:hypothetical protein
MNGASLTPDRDERSGADAYRTNERLTLFQGLFAKCFAQAGFRGGDILSGFDVLLFIIQH